MGADRMAVTARHVRRVPVRIARRARARAGFQRRDG